MTQIKVITGYYGSKNTPCAIYVSENRDGSRWYVVEGGQTVNKTFDDIAPGTNVEDIQDIDCFTWGSPIEDIYQFIASVES